MLDAIHDLPSLYLPTESTYRLFHSKIEQQKQTHGYFYKYSPLLTEIVFISALFRTSNPLYHLTSKF